VSGDIDTFENILEIGIAFQGKDLLVRKVE
jgi:hypothetical protein